MIRKIVIPVRGDGKGDNVFAHASALANRYKAHIVVTQCRPRVEDLMPYGVVIPKSMREMLLSHSADVANQVEDGLREEVQELAIKFGITLSDSAVEGIASASWIEEQGRQVDIIKRHGRLADLICVAQPDVDRNLGANTLKTALFNTGRPVMMCPHVDTPPETLCDKITIAWNGSIECSRAVALNIDIISSASEVTVLTSGTEIYGADANSLIAYLAARDINAGIERFVADRKMGEELLERSVALGADSMIMGAYGDSHERETVFGGNTQFIVDHSSMPVILVH